MTELEDRLAGLTKRAREAREEREAAEGPKAPAGVPSPVEAAVSTTAAKTTIKHAAEEAGHVALGTGLGAVGQMPEQKAMTDTAHHTGDILKETRSSRDILSDIARSVDTIQSGLVYG